MNGENEMKRVIVFMSFAFVLCALAGWERTYGGSGIDIGYSISQTDDGGFALCGYTTSYSSNSRFYLIRLNSEGDTLWTRTYSTSSSNCWANSLIPSWDNGFLIAGRKSGNAATLDDIFIVKTDSSGEENWRRTYGSSGNDGATSISKIVPNEYAISGYFSHSAYLMKLDISGNALWASTYGGSSTDSANSAIPTNDHEIIFVGMTRSFGHGNRDIFIVKTDSYGDTIWTKAYGGSGNELAKSVIETSDSCYIIAGRTNSFGSGGYDVYVLKLDSSGDTLWTRTYGSTNDEWANSICQSSDGGYAIVGYADFLGIGSNVYLLKIDSLGILEWTRTFSRSSNDEGHSIKATIDGGYVIAGSANYDVYVIKTNALGYTQIKESYSIKPESFSLSASPNPFNSAVRISLDCESESASVGFPYGQKRLSTIEIFDVNGRIVDRTPVGEGLRPSRSSQNQKTGVSETAPLRNGEFVWQPEPSLGSGVYLVRATAGDGESLTKRIVYLK
jgi:hypothetical protein